MLIARGSGDVFGYPSVETGFYYCQLAAGIYMDTEDRDIRYQENVRRHIPGRQ